MGILIVASFLLALPFVRPNTCPDGSQCPGDDTCCESDQGYRCCTIDGGDCCSDGMACCAPGTTCIPVIDICVPFSSNKNKALLPRVKSENPVGGQCPGEATDCGKGPSREECCPLPNAVCCSDGKHCCRSGYMCDLSAGTCRKNAVHPIQNMEVLKKTAQNVICPDGGQCPDGNTCCLIAGGNYGCCGCPNAVCCSDHLHCCPSGTKCNKAIRKCESGQYSIPWLQKLPTVKVKN